MSRDLQFAFAGDRDISVWVLDYLLERGQRPAALLVPSRNRASHADQLIQRCGFLPPERILRGTFFRSDEGIQRLDDLQLDYLMSIHFPYLMPRKVLSIPRGGCLNLHPALLPYNRGWHTINWAILDETPVGATLHFMEEGIDAGDIVAQQVVNVALSDTANSLYAKVKQAEFDLFCKTWPKINRGDIQRTPQSLGQGTSHSREGLLCPEVQQISLDGPTTARQLLRQLRALTTNQPNEAAYFIEQQKKFRVRVEIWEDTSEPAPTASDERIYLSPPHMGVTERDLLLNAFESNWIAPLGPHVDAFEHEFSQVVGSDQAVALSSGTAALHLALLLVGVEPGDDVFCSTLTFAATVNAIRYVGGNPVFIDSEFTTWNMDPQLLALALEEAAQRGQLPKAVVVVDVFGQCADYEAILKSCRFYEVPVIEDAAEALGASYRDRPAGSFGDIGCFSFNGNKIITTSGGGMLVTERKDWADQARFLASQARDPAPHYEHSQVGYNYRLSNLLAAVGRGQLRVLNDRVAKRRENFRWYQQTLGDLPGIEFMPEGPHSRSTRWLTVLTVDPKAFGASAADIRVALEKQNIEARPVWKPMHLQPVFANCRVCGGRVAEHLFARGLSLPSGSNLSAEDRLRIVEVIRKVGRTDPAVAAEVMKQIRQRADTEIGSDVTRSPTAPHRSY